MTEVGAGSPKQGNRESNVHLTAISSTISSMTKEARTCKGTSGQREGTVEDTSNDLYSPLVVVARKRGGNKATKKEVPTDQNLLKNMGLLKGGASDILRREGKRKVLVDLNQNRAHMQDVVHSISIWPKNIN